MLRIKDTMLKQEKSQNNMIIPVDFGSGVIQELSHKDLENGISLRVQWENNIILEIINDKYSRQRLAISKHDSILKSVFLRKSQSLHKIIMQAVRSIEKGDYLRAKSIREMTAEIISSRNLTSYMNDTKWKEFRKAMLYEMPFPPPYEMKTLFESDSYVNTFTASEPLCTGDYSLETFAGGNYKIIEYITVKPFYYECQGGQLSYKRIFHTADNIFWNILNKYNIYYEKINDSCYIFGYR